MGSVLSCCGAAVNDDDYEEYHKEYIPWIPIERNIYSERGIYTGVNCYVSDLWDYDQAKDGIAVLWSGLYQARLKWFCEKPVDLPLPRLEEYVNDSIATEEEEGEHQAAVRSVQLMNHAAWEEWYKYRFPKATAFVRMAIEMYCARHCLPLPLGYESRSHYLFLRFRSEEEGNLWLSAPADAIFDPKRAEMRRHRLVTPASRTTWKRPKIERNEEQTDAPVFTCGPGGISMPDPEPEIEPWVPMHD